MEKQVSSLKPTKKYKKAWIVLLVIIGIIWFFGYLFIIGKGEIRFLSTVKKAYCNSLSTESCKKSSLCSMADVGYLNFDVVVLKCSPKLGF